MKKLFYVLLILVIAYFCIADVQYYDNDVPLGAQRGKLNTNATYLDTRGYISMTTPDTTTMTTAGTYRLAQGVFTDPDGANSNFILRSNGWLVYTGEDNWFKVDGTSDTEVNKVCILQYCLAKNSPDTLIGCTPHNFQTANSTENISITLFMYLTTNDSVAVFLNSDTANTTVTPSNLQMTYGK
jgi:hypothetical protein